METNLVKQSTIGTNIVESVDILKYTIISNCSNCAIKIKCPLFSNKYNNIKNEEELLLKEQIDSNGKKRWFNTDDKYLEEIRLREQLKLKIDQRVGCLVDECEFEKDISKTTYYSLDKRYNFKENPHLGIMVGEIIKLKLNDFRLGNGFKEYGMISERTTYNMKSGITSKYISLTPGLVYSQECATKIADIIERMDKMMFGSKNINLNLNGGVVDIDDVLGRRNKDKEDEKIINITEID